MSNESTISSGNLTDPYTSSTSSRINFGKNLVTIKKLVLCVFNTFLENLTATSRLVPEEDFKSFK